MKDSSVQSLDFWSRRGDMRAEDTDNFLHAVLLAAVVRRAGMDRSVQPLTLSVQLFLCHLLPASTVPCMMVLERV